MKAKIRLSQDKLYVIADTLTFRHVSIPVMEEIRDKFIDLKYPMDHLVLAFECYLDIMVNDES